MIEIVGVAFKQSGKVYYFSPNGLKLKKGDKVIVETERGVQLGFIELENTTIDEKQLKASLNNIKKVASNKDYANYLKNIEDSKVALKYCKELVKKHNLNMMILDASYTFNKDQLLFTFLADNRVDFRKLAKDLANKYKTRIELKQVGVRDKAKEIGGYGSCGQVLCCSKFLTDFDSVSINMAKNQNIALNPTKINGACGRLLCCLKYENECYKELNKTMPKVNSKIKTEFGEGKIISIDPLNQSYRVDIKDHGIEEIKVNESSK